MKKNNGTKLPLSVKKHIKMIRKYNKIIKATTQSKLSVKDIKRGVKALNKNEALKIRFPLIKVPAVTVVKKSETYVLESEGYKIYVELNDNTIKITTLAHGDDFIFNTVRNPVTKRRWQALGRLIIEATKLI